MEISSRSGYFVVDLAQGKVTLGGTPVPCGKKWLEVCALLADHWNADRWVTREDIAQLPGWRGTSMASLGSALYRKSRELSIQGFPLFIHPQRGQTRALKLNAECVREVSVVRVPVVQVREPVGPFFPERCELILAECHFERGDYKGVLALVAPFLESASVVDRVRAHLFDVWVRALTLPEELSVARFRKLLTELDAEPVACAAILKARIWIQLGRLALLRGDLLEMQRTYSQAEFFLESGDLREWVSIWAGQALVLEKKGEWSLAMARQQQALDLAIKAKWTWGIHVQYANIGRILLGAHLQGQGDFLDAAKTALVQGLELALAFGFGGQTNLLDSLFRVWVTEPAFDGAWDFLDQIEALVETWSYTPGRIHLAEMRAGMHQIRGEGAHARSQLRLALRWARHIGDSASAQRIRADLARLN